MWGCITPINPYCKKEGCRTLVGQAETQSEHPVQILLKRSTERDPGGETGEVFFSGTVLSPFGLITFGFLGSGIESADLNPYNAAMPTTPVIKKFRLEVSVTIFFVLPFVFGSRPSGRRKGLGLAGVKFMACSEQTVMQLKQATHRL